MSDDDGLQIALQIALNLLQQVDVLRERDVDMAVAGAVAARAVWGGAKVDESALRRLIEANVAVFVDDGEVLEGENEDHVPWLEQKLSESDRWRFWEAYRAWQVQRLPRDVVNGIDRVTNDILGRLEDPTRPGPWDRRGMVVGQVQSGKTGNYTGLICKAADAGYPFIVVLAGVHNSLRSQTQRRIDEGFLGLDSRTSLFDGTTNHLGVAAGKKNHPSAWSLTSSDERGDFSKQIAGRLAGRIGRDPVILVVKKHKTILSNLIQWIGENNGIVDGAGRRVIQQFPMLLIDDEADYASVNTRKILFETNEDGEVTAETDPTAINRLIRELLNTFERSAFVSYTATPFANIFIHEEERSPKYGEDLFPRSFILRLPPPSNYFGPPQVFGVPAADERPDAPRRPLPVLVTLEDAEQWLETGHKKDAAPGRLPGSLKEAIRVFLLVAAVRRARGQRDVHNSMLVHVTRFVDVQQLVREQIQSEVDKIVDALRYGGEGKDSELALFRGLFEGGIVSTKAEFPENLQGADVSWEQVKAEIAPALARLQPVLAVNGSAGDVLTYVDHPDGVTVIAVGGDKLSRGLTLEGLTVSYYLRASKMYDTLMQMGRWFGYRDGYADLVRLYTTGELQKWYRDVTIANEDLNRKFSEMVAAKSNPREFALYVRKSPSGLLVTAQAKMRSGVDFQLSFSDEVLETTIFRKEVELQRRNTEHADAFLRERGTPTVRPGERGSTNFVWSDVPGDEVASFFAGFRTYEGATKVRSELLAEYVRDRVQAEQLRRWTVVLVHNTMTNDVVTFGGVRVGRVQRRQGERWKDRAEEENLHIVNRIGNPSDESVDLELAGRDVGEAWSNALERTLEHHATRVAEAAAKGKKRPQRPTFPAGWAARRERSPDYGLLVLYPLELPGAGLEEVEPTVTGFLVAFPYNPDDPGIKFVMPRRYFEDAP